MAIWYKANMTRKDQLFRYGSCVVYFVLGYVVLYWYAGSGYFCSRAGSLGSTFRLALTFTIWDSFMCSAGAWLAHNAMKVRTAAPLLGGAFTAAGLAAIPFWIHRGYGHFLFEGTWLDVSCFFTEENGMVFPFLMAPAFGILSALHGLLLLRITKEVPSTRFESL